MTENEKKISFKEGNEEVTITTEGGEVLPEDKAREFLTKLQGGTLLPPTMEAKKVTRSTLITPVAMKDTQTGRVWHSKATLGKELAAEFGIDPQDSFAYYQIISKAPGRFVQASKEEAQEALRLHKEEVDRELGELLILQSKGLNDLEKSMEELRKVLDAHVKDSNRSLLHRMFGRQNPYLKGG